MTDDRVHVLDPIYATTEGQRHKDFPPMNHLAEHHNKWRAALPETCWLCNNFDRCSPGHKCRHQVDIDTQAQLGVKHERY
jgi:hypothetical protein